MPHALSGHLAFFFLPGRLASEDGDDAHLDEIERDVLALKEMEEQSRSVQAHAPTTLFAALRLREAASKAAGSNA